MAADPKQETAKSDSGVDSNDGNVVSMVDVLEEEQLLEEDANAVLGGSDDRNCTYLQGYLGRQALYACSTCNSGDSDENTGVCLACSLECHDGHHLYELYTKRNFRCDCGNSKFKGFKCKLTPEKAPVNEDNSYNQNFKGLYCICARPYPDPDDDIEDEMIQCIVCEDWFHGRHIGRDAPDDFEELTCLQCIKKHPFLMHYETLCSVLDPKNGQKSVVQVSKETEETTDACVEGSSAGCNTDSLKRKDEGEQNEEMPSKKAKIDDVDSKNEGSHIPSEPEGECKLEALKKYSSSEADETEPHAIFWKNGWRSKLCRCTDCMKMYKDLEVSYLTSESDSINAYEARGKKAPGDGSQYEQGMKALSTMDRVQQVEVIQGYNDMKGALKEYLKSFADNGKVVSQEDIRAFFEKLASQKRSSSGMQYFCK